MVITRLSSRLAHDPASDKTGSERVPKKTKKSSSGGHPSRLVKVTKAKGVMAETLKQARAQGSKRLKKDKGDVEEAGSSAQDAAPSRPLPTLSQDIIRGIMIFSDQTTLHRWQLVNVASYRQASPILYRHIHIYTAKAFESLALDIVQEQDIEGSSSTADFMFTKVALLSSTISITVNAKNTNLLVSEARKKEFPLEKLQNLQRVHLKHFLDYRGHDVHAARWLETGRTIELTAGTVNNTGVSPKGYRQHITHCLSGWVRCFNVCEDALGRVRLGRRPIRLLFDEDPASVHGRFNNIFTAIMKCCQMYTQRDADVNDGRKKPWPEPILLCGIGVPSPGRNVTTAWLGYNPTPSVELPLKRTTSIVGTETECHQQIAELLIKATPGLLLKNREHALKFLTREEAKEWYDYAKERL